MWKNNDGIVYFCCFKLFDGTVQRTVALYSGGLTHLLQAQSSHLFLPPGWHGARPRIRIAHISHNPAVSLGTAGACDTVKQIFPSNYGNGITQTQIRTCVLGLTSQHCRQLQVHAIQWNKFFPPTMAMV